METETEAKTFMTPTIEHITHTIVHNRNNLNIIQNEYGSFNYYEIDL